METVSKPLHQNCTLLTDPSSKPAFPTSDTFYQLCITSSNYLPIPGTLSIP